MDGNRLIGTYEKGLREGKFIYCGLADYKFNEKTIDKNSDNFQTSLYKNNLDKNALDPLARIRYGISELSIFGTDYKCYAEGNYVDGVIEGRVEYYYNYLGTFKIISNYIDGIKEGLEIEIHAENFNSNVFDKLFDIELDTDPIALEIKDSINKAKATHIIRRTNYVDGEMQV